MWNYHVLKIYLITIIQSASRCSRDREAGNKGTSETRVSLKQALRDPSQRRLSRRSEMIGWSFHGFQTSLSKATHYPRVAREGWYTRKNEPWRDTMTIKIFVVDSCFGGKLWRFIFYFSSFKFFHLLFHFLSPLIFLCLHFLEYLLIRTSHLRT